MSKVDYKCTACGKSSTRDQLAVKTALFKDMGVGGAVIRSRTTGWLCPECLVKDEDYNRDRHESPDSMSRRVDASTGRT